MLYEEGRAQAHLWLSETFDVLGVRSTLRLNGVGQLEETRSG